MSAAVARLLTLLTLCGVLTLSGCAGQGPEDAVGTGPQGQPPAPSGTAESGDGSECEYVADDNAAKPDITLPAVSDVPHEGTVAYTLNTTAGAVTITMDRARTPCTVNSFASLVQQKFYNDTPCHRLADSGIFVLQCGDPTGTGRGGPGWTFADETTPQDSYPRGTVAMANGGPNTNGSQFFLVWDDSDLPPDYTVLGRMDEASVMVVAGVAAEGQDGSWGDGTGRPLNPVRIIDVSQD